MLPPVLIFSEIYDIVNIRKFLSAVKEKEAKEAETYGRSHEVKNMLVQLGIDMENAADHDFVTRMKIKMIGDI